MKYLKHFLANKINYLLFTACKISSIMVGYCYIYIHIKKTNFIACDHCERQKSHIFPYRCISELYSFVSVCAYERYMLTIYIYICIYIHVHTYIYAYLYTHIRTYTYTYTHTPPTHTHTHSYILTYIHT